MPQGQLVVLIALAVPASYALLSFAEWRWPAREWPAIRHWRMVGLLGFTALGLVNALISALLQNIFGRVSLLDGAALGPVAGALVGYLVLSFGNACLHRSYHRHDFLWRYVHQLHHAPRRIDVAGVMFQTPLEMAANALLFTGVTVFLLGLDPVATMAVAWLGAVYGMVQHANLRTPRWLGWFVQRPEAHSEHHLRGVHNGNYSDLPLWDMLWGSFSNPHDFVAEVGFEAEEAGQWKRMLAGEVVEPRRDFIAVTAEPAAR
jgi:sterol desaturase/sphingolipid hydroxylase (fatty acid hydroxylase superfamily)